MKTTKKLHWWSYIIQNIKKKLKSVIIPVNKYHAIWGTEPCEKNKNIIKNLVRILICFISCLFIWASFLLLLIAHRLPLLFDGTIPFDQFLVHTLTVSDTQTVIHEFSMIGSFAKIFCLIGILLGGIILLMIYRPIAVLVSKAIRFVADRPAFFVFLFSLCMCVASVCYFSRTFDLRVIAQSIFQRSEIIDDNYQCHRISEFKQRNSNGNLMKKSEKPNLVLIMCESLETTFSDSKLFGEDLLSELSAIKKDADVIENLYMAYGCHYSIASLYSVYFGIPLLYLQCPLRGPLRDNIFANKCISIFDVLNASGYHILHLQGCSHKFTGVGSFFSYLNNTKCIGSDEIPLSEYPSRSTDLHHEQLYGLWDSDLFDKVKKEITALSCKEMPFALSILTIDTHPGRTLQPGQECNYGDFRDVIRLQSKLVSNFVLWVKSQPFGSNTVIVILGDHLMDIKNVGMISMKILPERRIFNCIINSKAGTIMKQQEAAMFDFAPTILDALSFQWTSYSFGLGRSLYRDTPSIVKKYGIELWNRESQKGSKLYKQLISK